MNSDVAKKILELIKKLNDNVSEQDLKILNYMRNLEFRIEELEKKVKEL